MRADGCDVRHFRGDCLDADLRLPWLLFFRKADMTEGTGMSAQHRCPAPRPGGPFHLRVLRRHVDLLRVSSALCPETLPAR